MTMNYTTTNIAQAITDKIIAELEKHQQDGTLPSWVKPWNATGSDARPYNPMTKNHYNGVNWLWLSLLQNSGDYGSSNEWLTYKQAQTVTGLDKPIKAGSKSVQVIFYKTLLIKDKTATSDTGADKTKKIPMMKIYRVFNRDCIEGLEAPIVTEPRAIPERNQSIEDFIKATKAEINFGGARAFYNPSIDTIQVPNLEDFKTVEDYYSTIAHELTHWTGSEARLNRLKGDSFGSESYAFEELVAELGSAMVNAKLGLDGKLQHVENIGSWLKVLKNDSKAILKASALAQKALDYLENITGTKTNKSYTATA